MASRCHAPAGTVPVKFQWLWLSSTHVTQGSGTLRQAPHWEVLASCSPCCTLQYPALALHGWLIQDLKGDSRYSDRGFCLSATLQRMLNALQVWLT